LTNICFVNSYTGISERKFANIFLISKGSVHPTVTTTGKQLQTQQYIVITTIGKKVTDLLTSWATCNLARLWNLLQDILRIVTFMAIQLNRTVRLWKQNINGRLRALHGSKLYPVTSREDQIACDLTGFANSKKSLIIVKIKQI